MLSDETINNIDGAIKSSITMAPGKRFSWKRQRALEKLRKNLQAYTDNGLDMLLTLRSMVKALDQEIETVERMR